MGFAMMAKVFLPGCDGRTPDASSMARRRLFSASKMLTGLVLGNLPEDRPPRHGLWEFS